MKTTFFQLLIFSVTIFINGKTIGQKSTDFYQEIKGYNLSTILIEKKIMSENCEGPKQWIERPEILGFIGDDFQRFNISFLSIIQNPNNPFEYLVFGKTKVNETIRTFQGTFTVKLAEIEMINDSQDLKQGFAVFEVTLFEDAKLSSTGMIQGKLKSNFILDQKGGLRYDAISFCSDSFTNNQFIGTWTSYKTKVSKRCNWGEFRIPECGDLDVGAAEFSVNEKYRKNGWNNLKP